VLVLSRKISESIVIGDDVVITVVKISPYQVRLGITAPKSLSVHRHEVWKAIQGRPHDAATPTAGSGGQGSPCKSMVRPILPDGFTRP
jgi:carbon storage regulator